MYNRQQYFTRGQLSTPLRVSSSQGWGGAPPSVPPSLGYLSGAYQDASQVAGAATTGASVAPLLSGSAAAGPIGLAIGAGIVAVTLLIGKFQKTGRQKVASTTIVNDVEPLLRRNLSAYLVSNRTRSDQAQSTTNFHTLWRVVLDNCSDPALGSAGQRCINERREGGVAPWGQNWFIRYLDPIRDDPDVVPDAGLVPVTTVDPVTGQQVTTLVPGNYSGSKILGADWIAGIDNIWLVGGGLALVAVVTLGGGGDGDGDGGGK